MANRWSDKEWRSALRLALLEKHEKHGTKLRAIAETVVEAALGGDLSAAQEIGNRLDGRPAQDLNVNSTVTHELASHSDEDIARELLRRGTKARGTKAGNSEGLH